MKQMLYFQTKMKAVEEKGDALVVSGYASTGDLDRGGDRVLPEAFTETVRDRASKSPIPMLLQHDGDKVLGDWSEMEIDAKGLLCTGSVKYDIDDCKIKIKNGDLRGLSIGYRVEEYEVEREDGTTIYNSISGLCPCYDVDDMWNDDCIRIIKKIDLVEISVVSTPMNPYAFINSVKDFFAQEKKNLTTKPQEVKEEETPVEVTPEIVEEVQPSVVAEEPNNQEIVVETPAVETPAPEVIPEETTTPDISDVVKADEVPEVVPEVVEPLEPVEPTEPVEETPKGITEEEVKALVASAVSEAVAPLIETIAWLKKSLDDDTLAKSYETLKKDFDALNSTLSQEVFPEKKSMPSLKRGMNITDEMVLGTFGR